jgi:hypothetical protein
MIFIQLLGGAGYIILLLATQISTRRGFLIADYCGLIPVATHYALLGAPVGAAMSILYMLIDMTAVFENRAKFIRHLYLVYYILAIILAGITFQQATDLFALFGTLAALISRQQSQMHHLLLMIVVSCVGWGLYGIFAGSVAQVVFSMVYALFSLLGIWRIVRQTHT